MGKDPAVLVTGAGGQMGVALREQLPGACFLTHSHLDVRDSAAVQTAVRGFRTVIHLAAMTDVDACEKNPELAHEINGLGTRNVVEAAHEAGARVVYISTDYVFDGTKIGAYEEEDPPRPINAYGRSKLDGERHVLGESTNLIVRTSWVYGVGNNFIQKIIRAGETNGRLRVVDDQRGRPTWARDLATALIHLVSCEASALVHVSSDGPPCTWADLAEQVLALRGLKTVVDRIESQSYSDQAGHLVAPRPRNSVLALDRSMELGVPLSNWIDSVETYVGGLP